MDPGFRMHAERTPNPHSVKWVTSVPVARDTPARGSASFSVAPTAEVSPLAARLFEVEGVTAVFLGPDFVTISKREDREWTDLAPGIVTAIKAWAASGESAVGAGFEPPAKGDEGELVARIREILESDIQPYVEQDGGEIAFAGYRDGVVEVYLRGACAGCPSSTITLKMGIESRLKEELPEVTSVVAL